MLLTGPSKRNDKLEAEHLGHPVHEVHDRGPDIGRLRGHRRGRRSSLLPMSLMVSSMSSTADVNLWRASGRSAVRMAPSSPRPMGKESLDDEVVQVAPDPIPILEDRQSLPGPLDLGYLHREGSLCSEQLGQLHVELRDRPRNVCRTNPGSAHPRHLPAPSRGHHDPGPAPASPWASARGRPGRPSGCRRPSRSYRCSGRPPPTTRPP